MSVSLSDLASEKVRLSWRTLAQHWLFAYLAVTLLCLALGSFSDLLKFRDSQTLLVCPKPSPIKGRPGP